MFLLVVMTWTQTYDNIFYNFILLGPIDDIDLDQFDPDGVDFEPLLVSGSKFILFFVNWLYYFIFVQAIAILLYFYPILSLSW